MVHRGGNASYVIGDLRAWGWVMTIFGAAQLVAAAGVWLGNQVARWFAVAVVGLNAVAQMFFIPAYRFWSLMIIAANIVALWGQGGIPSVDRDVSSGSGCSACCAVPGLVICRFDAAVLRQRQNVPR